MEQLITEEMIQAGLARADWPKLHLPFFFVPGYVREEDCPFCPKDDVNPCGWDFYGSLCEIDGVACCEVCYEIETGEGQS